MSKKPITAHIGAGMLLFSAICFLIGSFITLSDIGLRSLANSNLDAAIELTTLTIALGALVSIPMTYAREGHITARLISEFSPPVVGRFMRIQGALMSLLFMGILFYACGLKLMEQYGSPETTPDTGTPVDKLMMVVVACIAMSVIATAYQLGVCVINCRVKKELSNG